MQDTFKLAASVIAHRGASGYAPENTMVAFTKAAQLGAKWVEFDVKLTGDDIPIVFHDEILDRTTNGKGCICDYPYAYLQSLDAGSWFNAVFSGERIPSFSEVLDFLIHNGMNANVEIKPGPGEDAETTRAIFREITKKYVPPYSNILFSSFSVPALKLLRKLSPDCFIGFLIHEWIEDWQQICDELNCVSVHVNQLIMTEEHAKYIKATGRKLLCYTVNDPNRARELFAWGVDAVFSDVPDKVLNLR